jgi:flagellar hook-associated protein 3 FlgL
MITRVTSTQLLANSAQTMQAAMARLSTLQQQASSGKRISVPSDDPSGTAASMQVRGQQAAVAQYQRNASDGMGWLATVDGALSNSTALLQQARNLVVQAANSGAMSQAGRDAIASQLQGIRDDLLQTANTQYNGRSVFAGTSDTPAFDTTTYAWSGTASASVDRRVGSDAAIRVDADGSAAFGSGATSVFASLDTIISNLHSGADVSSGITAIDAGLQSVSGAQVVSGSRYAQMERAKDSLSSQSIDLESRRSDVEDVDTVQSLVALQSQNLAYQAALQVTAKALPMSLLSFLS